MIGRAFQRILRATLFLISLHSCLCAEDIVTKSGKVLRNAEIIGIEGGQVTIEHAGGTEKLWATDIPEPLQKRFRDQELKRKADEVEKLKQELARRERELGQLKQEGEKLRRDTAQRLSKEAEERTRQDTELQRLKEENERLAREVKPATPIPEPAVAKPSRSIEQLPEVKDGDVMDARDLVLYYQTDAAGADRRFRKKTFQIKGVVDKFEPRMFVRLYDVLLQSPEKSVGVVCKFSYADRWNAVYTKDRGRLLVAKDKRSEDRLLEVGDSVTIRARCEGLKGSDLVFSHCELVR
jgi:hypothetical protein